MNAAKAFEVVQADCIEFLRGLPEKSADLVFCSPPYEQARLYLENGEDLSIARDTEEWVGWMVEVVRASLHACKGLCAFVVEGQTRDYRYTCSPALLMADLHREGITLRKPPIYKRSGIPGSGGPDWLRNDFEWVICCTNGGKLPWSDNVAMGHAPKYAPGGDMSNRLADGSRVNDDPWNKHGRGNSLGGRKKNGEKLKGNGRKTMTRQRRGSRDNGIYDPPAIANPGNVIDCGCAGGGNMGENSALCHEGEAPFPEYLAEFFVRSFASPGGLVIDPFVGSGTTATVAVRWQRRFYGCDLRQSQVELTRKRVSNETPLGLYDLSEGTP